MPPPAPPRPQRRTALGRLDDSLVPGLQRVSRAVAHVLSAPARVLRSIDDRVASGRVADGVRTHRTGVVFLVVAMAFGATAVHAQRYPELNQSTTAASAGDGSDGSSTIDDGGVIAAGPGALGPTIGQDVDDYLEAAASRLAGAGGDQERLAVVSFEDFETPTAVAGLFGDATTLHRAMYQLPERDPRPQTLEVEDGLAAAVDGLVDQLVGSLRAEESEVESTIASGVEDPEFLADYEARLDELRAIRNILSQQPRILYAVVVTAPPDVLRSLAERDNVRVVDVAAEDAARESTAAAGLLPTDRETVSAGLAG